MKHSCRNEQIKDNLIKLGERIEVMDKMKTKNNIIVTGLWVDSSKKGILWEGMMNFFKKKLDIEVEINRVHKLWKKVCLKEFENFLDKIKVMKNKNKLRENKN